MPYVNVELPEELQQPLIHINTENISGQENDAIILKPRINNDVPYGVLKGGLKPTYRDWNKTQRNIIVTNPNSALTVPTENNNISSTRETRLHNLREKIKQKQLQENRVKNNDNDIMFTQNLIQKPNIETNEINKSEQFKQPIIENKQNYQKMEIISGANIVSTNEPLTRIIGTKRITKKTIKRKYTLGKSKIKKSISVLVKDRGTRKRILDAQKDLKRKQISDIKIYLREHNLIKIGSNAPNDVLRKLYESAMLAGEITNSNTEILLHNFSKNDKEL